MACLFLLELSRFAHGKPGRCGGLIQIVQENPDGFPAHTLSLQNLIVKKRFSRLDTEIDKLR